MIRGTTPTFTLKLKEDSGIDLRQAQNVYFTIAQGHNTLTKSGNDVLVQEDGRTVLVYLNQEESLAFNERADTEIQLNWTYFAQNGQARRAASVVKRIQIDKQLYRKVIE